MIEIGETGNLLMHKTEDTPQVRIDSKGCKVTGSLHCVDPDLFFNPLMKWAQGFISNHNSPFTVEFCFSHINSASISYLLRLIKTLLTTSIKNRDAIVFRWYVDQQDSDMEDSAITFNEILGNRIEIVYVNEYGHMAEPNKFGSRNIPRSIAKKLFTYKFSKKYNQEVIVFNPLFFKQ